ncbi:MAG TPA: TadE/TadG family type IV pilus assembly protein [Terriglobia bacterium]|nr:TadE/TadG family type IV pilus assembly protein [Terriglobia bacterium]
MSSLTSETRKNLRIVLQRRSSAQTSARMRIWRAAAGTEGSQLLELALALPLLLVFVVGIIQFGGAFNLKQKEANAAREGARVMVSTNLSDTNCASGYCSVQAAAAAIANYMTNAGVDSSCLSSASPSPTGPPTWTYSCKGITVTINNQFGYTAGGSPVTGTQVTVTYPFNWFFNDIIKLLVPGARLSIPNSLTETAVMQNIATGS